MNEYHEANTPSRIILLNELRSSLDQKIRHGETFEHVKKLYIQIKAFGSQLGIINWRKQKNLNTGNQNMIRRRSCILTEKKPVITVQENIEGIM